MQNGKYARQLLGQAHPNTKLRTRLVVRHMLFDGKPSRAPAVIARSRSLATKQSRQAAQEESGIASSAKGASSQ